MSEQAGKILVCLLLVISALASLFVVWTIAFRLRSHLISVSYRFILAAKICFTVLSLSGIYLVLFSPSISLIDIQLISFSILAVGIICSAIGFHLYARDVGVVLKSEDYLHALPVEASKVHKNSIKEKN